MLNHLKKTLVALAGFLALVLAAPAAHAGALDGNSSDVLLQGFHWYSYQTYPWWGIVKNNAATIKGAGFTMVWLPPPSDSASNEGYLPRQLNILDSKYGATADLKAALSALNTNGVKPIADLVLNHRVGTNNWADFTNPAWGSDSVCQGDEWTGATGAPDTGDGYGSARDIDHTKQYVQDSIVGWMNNTLKPAGFAGWRYDYVKGYGGSYVGSYNTRTAPYFSVGEYWTTLDLNNVDPHRQLIMNWIDATGGNSGAFDFTTKGILQQAVQYNEFWRLKDSAGKPAGAVGWWPAKVVTFIDNHDTGPSTPSGGQNLWPFPSDKILQGSAYIEPERHQDDDQHPQVQGHHQHLGGEHPGRGHLQVRRHHHRHQRQGGGEDRLRRVGSDGHVDAGHLRHQLRHLDAVAGSGRVGEEPQGSSSSPESSDSGLPPRSWSISDWAAAASSAERRLASSI